MVKVGDVLTLYRFGGLPIPLTQEMSVQVIGLEDKIIGLTKDVSLFEVFTKSDLQQCGKLGTFFLCDDLSVLRRGLQKAKNEDLDSDLCLYFLITRRLEAAAKVCPLHLTHDHETVVKVGPKSFLTFSPKRVNGLITCDHRNDTHHVQRAFTMHQVKRLELPFGCHADTPGHRFSTSDASFTRHDWQVLVDWPAIDKDILDGIPITSIVQLHQNLTQNKSSTKAQLTFA